MGRGAEEEKEKEKEGKVSLTYLPPPTHLAALFGPIYYFVADKPQVSDHTRAELAQIRFMLSGEGDYIFPEHRATTPAACLLGPTNAATRFEVDGPLRVLGVSILPLGWAALGLGDASAVADDVRDLTQITGWECESLLVRLRAAIDGDDLDAAAALLGSFLSERVGKPTPAELAFVEAADAWLTAESSPRVEALQKATGLSARQVARLCNRYYGAPPKFVARKYRALRCASVLAHDQRDWTELVHDTFYDQSHFIREFKHFIGLTPSQLRTNASLVLRLTMARREIDGTIAELSRVS